MTGSFEVKPGAVLPEPDKPVLRPTYPWTTLKVGGMFFVPDKSTVYLSTYAAARGRKLGRSFSTQTTTMRQDLETGQWEPCRVGAPGARTGVVVRRVS